MPVVHFVYSGESLFSMNRAFIWFVDRSRCLFPWELWNAFGSNGCVQIQEAFLGSLLARRPWEVACDGVLRQGPCQFDNSMVLIAPYDGLSDPTLI